MSARPWKPPTHAWDLTPKAAVQLQRVLYQRYRSHLVAPERPGWWPQTVAGTDISYDRGSDVFYSAVVLWRRQGRDWHLERTATHIGRAPFPYVPGLLSFREIPLLLPAFARLDPPPELIVADGQGIAHPRRFGLATHLGLVLGIPALGCAKSLLTGTSREPGQTRGSRTRLIDRSEQVGWTLRSRAGTNPVYVSPGIGVGMDDARRIVTSFCRGYRVPEVTRQAHLAVNRLRRECE